MSCSGWAQICYSPASPYGITGITDMCHYTWHQCAFLSNQNRHGCCCFHLPCTLCFPTGTIIPLPGCSRVGRQGPVGQLTLHPDAFMTDPFSLHDVFYKPYWPIFQGRVSGASVLPDGDSSALLTDEWAGSSSCCHP